MAQPDAPDGPDAVQEAYGVWAGDEYVEASSGGQKFFREFQRKLPARGQRERPSFLLRFSVLIDALDASTPVHAAQGLRGGDECDKSSGSKSKKGGTNPPCTWHQIIPGFSLGNWLAVYRLS